MVDEKLNFATTQGHTSEGEEVRIGRTYLLRKNYYYIHNKRLLGCVIVERIETAYPIYNPQHGEAESQEEVVLSNFFY
jgi:hypothetical protein